MDKSELLQAYVSESICVLGHPINDMCSMFFYADVGLFFTKVFLGAKLLTHGISKQMHICSYISSHNPRFNNTNIIVTNIDESN